MADTAAERPAFSGRLLWSLADWSRTGVVVLTIIASGIRWTSNVDSRLTSIEDKVIGQRGVMEQAMAETTRHANMASAAAERAETAVARAEAAVADNQGAQRKMLAGTGDNRKAIETQTRRLTDLKTEMKRSFDSFEWRIRMLEEQSRKALEKHS